jgi:hypothetical protein
MEFPRAFKAHNPRLLKTLSYKKKIITAIKLNFPMTVKILLNIQVLIIVLMFV